MELLLKADGRAEAGGSALLMHSERLADPLDEATRAIAAISKKRNKTEADHMEIARLEFLGGMYTNGNGPCLPAWNVLRCLQEGAKRHKRGADVLRGVYPRAEHVDLHYDGSRVPDELWRVGGFALRKTVGVRGNRTVRTRPLFAEWTLGDGLLVEVDPKIFDVHSLKTFWKDAGVYVGLGDMRPIYGRFDGTIEVVGRPL